MKHNIEIVNAQLERHVKIVNAREHDVKIMSAQVEYHVIIVGAQI